MLEKYRANRLFVRANRLPVRANGISGETTSYGTTWIHANFPSRQTNINIKIWGGEEYSMIFLAGVSSVTQEPLAFGKLIVCKQWKSWYHWLEVKTHWQNATVQEYTRRCNKLKMFMKLLVILVRKNYMACCLISKASIIGFSFSFLFIFCSLFSRAKSVFFFSFFVTFWTRTAPRLVRSTK